MADFSPNPNFLNQLEELVEYHKQLLKEKETKCSDIEIQLQKAVFERDKQKDKLEYCTKTLQSAIEDFTYERYHEHRKNSQPFENDEELDTNNITDQDEYIEEIDLIPMDNIHSEYAANSMIEAILKFFRANPNPISGTDMAKAIYNYETKEEFARMRNSLNATLSYGSKNNHWQRVERGLYAPKENSKIFQEFEQFIIS